MVEKVAQRIGARAGISTVGAAVIGLGISTAVGLGSVALDEWQSHKGYKQEIIDAIEESRAETLAELQAA